MYAVCPDDNTRNNILAPLEVQPYPGSLFSESDQPATKTHALGWHGEREETLEGSAVQGKAGRTHLLLVPGSNWVGPDKMTVGPASNFNSPRDMCVAHQIDAQSDQQPSRIAADRDAGANLSQFPALLEDFHTYRLPQQAARQGQAADACPDDRDVTFERHVVQCEPAPPDNTRRLHLLSHRVVTI
jgi:hypothetical protein